MFGRMVLAARIVLGVFYLMSGLNWFFGFLPMLPHVGMPDDLPIKHAVVAEMIRTGWMFQSAKILEVLFGLSLLFNRAVPLMLAAALPVAFLTFMLDALILDDVWRWFAGAQSTQALGAAIEDMVIGGLCVLLPHLWLMWCYGAYYRPAFAWKAAPAPLGSGNAASMPLAPPATERVWLLRGFFAFGWVAIALQSYNLVGFMLLMTR
jgi:hypothetical protein